MTGICTTPAVFNNNMRLYYEYPYTIQTYGNYALQLTPPKTVISEPKTVEIAAYGLEAGDIDIKQIGDEVTVKSKKVDRFHAEFCKVYALKNTKLVWQILKNGVLMLKFNETEDVKHYQITIAS